MWNMAQRCMWHANSVAPWWPLCLESRGALSKKTQSMMWVRSPIQSKGTLKRVSRTKHIFISIKWRHYYIIIMKSSLKVFFDWTLDCSLFFFFPHIVLFSTTVRVWFCLFIFLLGYIIIIIGLLDTLSQTPPHAPTQSGCSSSRWMRHSFTP